MVEMYVFFLHTASSKLSVCFTLTAHLRPVTGDRWLLCRTARVERLCRLHLSVPLG